MSEKPYCRSENAIVQEIRRLDVIERLDIVTDIWNEIRESQELETVSEEMTSSEQAGKLQVRLGLRHGLGRSETGDA